MARSAPPIPGERRCASSMPVWAFRPGPGDSGGSSSISASCAAWVATPSDLVVTVTPTYSGCPATEVIMASIREALGTAGFEHVGLETRLSPAWTTDWISTAGKRKLHEFGIAPPDGMRAVSGFATIDVTGISPLRRARIAVACPRCGSIATRQVSQFGSTACKAHYRCTECLEPFDYFKPH